MNKLIFSLFLLCVFTCLLYSETVDKHFQILPPLSSDIEPYAEAEQFFQSRRNKDPRDFALQLSPDEIIREQAYWNSIRNTRSDTVVIGEGIEFEQKYPLSWAENQHTLSQSIYLETEMQGKTGEIIQLIYRVGQDNHYPFHQNPVTIWLGTTSQDIYTNTPQTWVQMSNFTLVYEGGLDVYGPSGPVASDCIINLDTPFQYDGGNLVIMMLKNDGYIYNGGPSFQFTNTTGFSRSIIAVGVGTYSFNPVVAFPNFVSPYYIWDDYSNNMYIDCEPIIPTTFVPKRPNIRIVFAPSDIFNAPENLVATPGNTQVSLSWTAPDGSTASVDSYEVFRKTSGSFASVQQNVLSTTYTDTGLTNNTLYTYYVVAHYTSPVAVSDPSNQVSAIPTSSPTPYFIIDDDVTDLNFGTIEIGKPENKTFIIRNIGTANLDIHGFSIKGGYGSVWTIDPTSVSIAAAGLQTFTMTFTPLLDQNYDTYLTIQHNAMNSINYRINLLGVGFTNICNPPTSLLAIPGNAEITLFWVAPVGSTGTIASYEVFRKTSGGYSSVQSNINGTSFLDTGLTNDIIYTYHVLAHYTSPTGISVPSNEASAMPAAFKPPQDLIATPGNKIIGLTWSPPAEGSIGNFLGYSLFRDNVKIVDGEGATYTQDFEIATSLTNIGWAQSVTQSTGIENGWGASGSRGFYASVSNNPSTRNFTTNDLGTITTGMFLSFDYRVIVTTTTPASAEAYTLAGNLGNQNHDRIEVQVSTNGSTFSTIHTFKGDTHIPTSSFNTFLYNLDSYTGQNLTVRFSMNRNVGNWTFCLDNLQILRPYTALNYSDTGLTNGTEYTYYTTAHYLNQRGMSAPSNIAKATPFAPSAPIFSVLDDIVELDFDQVETSTTDSKTFTIYNVGTENLIITNIIINNSYSGVWSCSPPVDHLLIEQSAQRTFTVTFAPTATQTYDTFLTIQHNASNDANYQIDLLGEGYVPPAPVFAVDGSVDELDFDQVVVNATDTKTFTVKNSGNANLNITGFTFDNAYSGVWSIAPTTANIASSGQQVFTVTFAPTATQTYDTFLTIQHNASNDANYQIDLLGEGYVEPFPIFNIVNDLNELDFGDVQLYESVEKSFTIKNIGTGDLNIIDFVYNYYYLDVWTIVPPTAIIEPGHEQVFTVTFQPINEQIYNTFMTIMHDASNHQEYQIDLIGKGFTEPYPILTVINNLDLLDFGDVVIYETVEKSFTIRNSGMAPLNINEFIYLYTYVGVWEIRPASAIIEPNTEETFTVTFVPISVQNYETSFIINHNAPNDLDYSIELKGNGSLVNIFNPPVDLKAIPGDQQVLLSWTPPTGSTSNIYGYEIFRKISNQFSSLVSNVQGTSYLDTAVVNGIEYTYYVITHYIMPIGVSEPSNVVLVTPNSVSVIDELIIYQQNTLLSNYPNPFNPETTIQFVIVNNSYVTIEIYDIKGKKIKTLLQQQMSQGIHSVIWKGDDDYHQKIGSGVYFYLMKTNDGISFKKMVMVK